MPESSFHDPFFPPLGQTVKETPFPKSQPKGQDTPVYLDESEEFEGPSVISIIFRWILFLAMLGGLIWVAWFFFFRNDTEWAAVNTSEIPSVELRESNSAKIIGAAGGKVFLEDGAMIEIPSGALDRDIFIEIEKIREGGATDLYHLKPDYLKFINPVKVFLPYRPGSESPIQLFSGRTTMDLAIPHSTLTDARNRMVSALIKEF